MSPKRRHRLYAWPTRLIADRARRQMSCMPFKNSKKEWSSPVVCSSVDLECSHATGGIPESKYFNDVDHVTRTYGLADPCSNGSWGHRRHYRSVQNELQTVACAVSQSPLRYPIDRSEAVAKQGGIACRSMAPMIGRPEAGSYRHRARSFRAGQESTCPAILQHAISTLKDISDE